MIKFVSDHFNFVCLLTYEFCLSLWKIARCSVILLLPLFSTGWWFSPGPPVSSTNKTDRHDITEIMLKMALNTIKQIIKKVLFREHRCIKIQLYIEKSQGVAVRVICEIFYMKYTHSLK
jgi:hypothetical protein